MKKISIRTLTLTLFFSSSVMATNHSPTLLFQLKNNDQFECSIDFSIELLKEAKSRIPFWKTYWGEKSPIIFYFLKTHFVSDFSQPSYLVQLSACPTTTSYSRPLILNISRFLISHTGESNQHPDYVFVILTFHELMHNWIEDNLYKSDLLRKYASESRTVKVHLHLMALEKYVYSEMKMFNHLKYIQNKYPKIGGDYARAWQIVNTEGHLNFISELKNM